MSKKLFTSWWVLLLRGIIIIAFGCWVLWTVFTGIEDPVSALISLSIYFGILVFATGVINIIGALRQGGPREDWIWLLTSGMLDLLVGVLIMVFPFMTGPIVLLLIGYWVLMGSVLQITHALLFKEHLRNWKATIFYAVLLIVMSFVYLTLDIEESAAMIFYLMASTMFIIGMANIVLSLSVKGMSPRKVREMRGNA